MSKLVILRGIPASGKSTFAREWVKADKNRVRINRDDIRMSLFGSYWGPEVDEQAVTIAQDQMLLGFLRAGRDVVLDNTNLKSRDVRAVLKNAAKAGAEVEFNDFPIDVPTAVKRDGGRTGRSVGAAVIIDFYQRYTPKGELPSIPVLDSEVSAPFVPYVEQRGLPTAIIVDIDGTVADMAGKRGPYDTSKYHLDEPHHDIISLVYTLEERHGYDIIFLSGRSEDFRAETEAWLDKNMLDRKALYMRPSGDTRNDAIVKDELFEKYIAGKYNVDFVIDDRDRVVDMWRAKGLRCLQVADGNF